MIALGSALFSRYEVIRKRSASPFRGATEALVEAYDALDKLTQEPVVAKVFPIPADPTLALLASALWDREVRSAHLATSSPRGAALLRLIDARKDLDNSALVIVSESTSRSLAEVLSSRPYPDFLRPEGRAMLWSAFLHLAEGVESLHSNGLIHRAISPESVYVSDTEDEPLFRLGDFSWSVYLHGLNRMVTDAARTIEAKGPPDGGKFSPPEATHGATRYGESFASDMFSLGVLIAECLLGPLPRREQRDVDWTLSVRQLVLESPLIQGEESRLVHQLLDPSPPRRPTAAETVDRLRALSQIAGRTVPTSQPGPMTVVMDLRPQSKIWNALSSWIAVDGLATRQSEFLETEFNNVQVYVRNDRPDFPGSLWCRGNSGTPYEFTPYKDRRSGRDNTSVAAVWPIPFIPPVEGEPILVLDKGVKGTPYGWQQPSGSSWSAYFALARQGPQPEKAPPEGHDLVNRLRLTLDAERELLSRTIYAYRVSRPVELEGQYRVVEIKLDPTGPDPEFDTRTRPSVESWYRTQFVDSAPEVELSESARPEARMLATRRWRIREILGDDRLVLEGHRSGDAAPQSGWVRPWPLRYLVPLLDRKRRAVDQVEVDQYLLNVLTSPGSVTIFHRTKKEGDLVDEILGVRPLFLLQGPPGTGKTHWASKVIEALLREDETARILVSAQAHKPLDHLMDQAERALSHLGLEPPPVLLRLTPKDERLAEREPGRPNDLDEVTRRVLQRASEWKPTVAVWNTLGHEWRELVRAQIADPSPAWERLLQGSANVIFVTSTSAGLRSLERTAPFDFVIIEEAGKAYAPELLPPMRLGRRWLLIGDQQQLPPFQHHEMLAAARRRLERDSGVGGMSETERISFAESLDGELRFFGHLFQKTRDNPYPFKPKAADAPAKRLSEQWRMPATLSEFISTIFYHDRFVVRTPLRPLPFENPTFIRSNSLVWISTPHCAGSDRSAEERIVSGGGYTNPYEAKTIDALLRAVGPRPLPPDRTLVVLSPYSAQVALLKRQLGRGYRNLPSFDSEKDVHTVDSFQGREADVVVVSLVRNNDREHPLSALGFLTLEERMNVLLSRASSQLIVVGCLAQLEHFSSSPEVGQIGKIPDFVRRHGEVVRAGELVGRGPR